MSNIDYKTYITSMIESLVKGKNQTDLGKYVLEYKHSFAEIGQGDFSYGDSCLAVASRLKNKDSGLIEWGNIYYKKLVPNSCVPDARKKLEKMYDEICESSIEDKLEFILRPETLFVKKPYERSLFINPEISSFFKNLNYSSELSCYIDLGGYFPKDALPYLEETFSKIIQGEEANFDKFINYLGLIERNIEKKKFEQTKSNKNNLTLQEIGEETTKNFVSNPQKAIDTIDDLENGAKTQDPINKG